MQNIKEVLSKIEALVECEYTLIDEDDDSSSEYPCDVKDSFGELRIRSQLAPEDAIWSRGLQDNFYNGVSLGIRNTLKVIAENPELLQQFTQMYTIEQEK
jgi:hypothetical protein